MIEQVNRESLERERQDAQQHGRKLEQLRNWQSLRIGRLARGYLVTHQATGIGIAADDLAEVNRLEAEFFELVAKGELPDWIQEELDMRGKGRPDPLQRSQPHRDKPSPSATAPRKAREPRGFA